MGYLIDIVNFLEFTDVDIPNPKFYIFYLIGQVYHNCCKFTQNQVIFQDKNKYSLNQNKRM